MGRRRSIMSALARVLAVCVLNMCLFHALPGAAAENLLRSGAAAENLLRSVADASVDGCGTKPADIVFLLDSSGSVGDANFYKVKEFVKHFVNSVNIGPKEFNVGVVTFATQVKNEFWLNTYTTKSSLLQAIDNIPYIVGGTSTDYGLKFVRQESFTKAHGDRDDANNILVVVTDGESALPTLTAEEANELHKTNIKVIAVGVGKAVQSELKAIASDDRSVFEVTNFDALKSIQDGLRTTACEDAVDECRTLSGSGDIEFLLDSSGSVGPANFEKVKDFVKHMAKSFKIGPDEVEIGVVTFAMNVHDEFWLKNYTTESSLIQAIDRIQYCDGTTRTDLALSYARQNAFSKEHGDRDDAANILIVITDGQSDYPQYTDMEAEELRKSDMTVLVIGIGDYVDEPELEKIANGKQNVFDVTDFSALDTVKDKLKKTTCRAIASAPNGFTRDVAAPRRHVFRDNEE